MESINDEGKYSHGKLKKWKECIKTNFHGQDVSYNIYCKASVVTKTESVQKKGQNYDPHLYVKDFKYTDAESQQSNILNDMIQMTMDLLRCKTGIKKCTENKFL